MRAYKIILSLFIIQIVLFPQVIYCQTEKLGSVIYTPPKGWIRNAKVKNVVVFSEANKTAMGKFCVITLYGAIVSAGDPAKDFEIAWADLAVKPFKATLSPKRLDPDSFEGWTVITAGSKIQYKGRDTTIILTLFSGFGKTVSVLSVSDDKSYKTQIEAFIASIGIEKTTPPAARYKGDDL